MKTIEEERTEIRELISLALVYYNEGHDESALLRLTDAAGLICRHRRISAAPTDRGFVLVDTTRKGHALPPP
jgi:hypothetical protein